MNTIGLVVVAIIITNIIKTDSHCHPRRGFLNADSFAWKSDIKRICILIEKIPVPEELIPFLV